MFKKVATLGISFKKEATPIKTPKYKMWLLTYLVVPFDFQEGNLGFKFMEGRQTSFCC